MSHYHHKSNKVQLPCIFRLCQSGNYESVKSIISNNQDEVMADDPETGNTPLHYAASVGNLQIICLLVGNSAKINSQNHYGWTPLMQAARKSHGDAVALLLHVGVDINITNKYGMSAVHCAVRSGNLNILRLINESHYAGTPAQLPAITPLMISCQHDYDFLVKYLLLSDNSRLNDDVESTRVSALMLASLKANAHLVHSLLVHGADLQATNKAGMSALDIAMSSGNAGAVSVLEQCGCESGSVDSKQSLEIFKIIEKNDVSRLGIYINFDCESVNRIRKEDGQSPLIAAVINGETKLVKILLKNGAGVDVRDKKGGWTALMHAAYRGNRNMCRLLLEHNANSEIRSFHGFSASDIVGLAANPDVKLLKLFESHLVSEKTNSVSSLKSLCDKYESKDELSRVENRACATIKSLWKKISHGWSKKYKIDTGSCRLTANKKCLSLPDMMDDPDKKMIDIKQRLRNKSCVSPRKRTSSLHILNTPNQLFPLPFAPRTTPFLDFNELRTPERCPKVFVIPCTPGTKPNHVRSVSTGSCRKLFEKSHSKVGTLPNKFSLGSCGSLNSTGDSGVLHEVFDEQASALYKPIEQGRALKEALAILHKMDSDLGVRSKSAPQRKYSKKLHHCHKRVNSSADIIYSPTVDLTPNPVRCELFKMNSDQPAFLIQPCKPLIVADNLDIVLRRLGLQRYFQNFIDHEVDFETFYFLNDMDLVELGIEDSGHRKLVMDEISKARC